MPQIPPSNPRLEIIRNERLDEGGPEVQPLPARSARKTERGLRLSWYRNGDTGGGGMGLWDELFDDEVMRAPEIAATLRVSLWTAQRLARDGVLEAHREYCFGGTWFFSAASVHALKNKRRYVGKGHHPTLSHHRKRVLRRQKREGVGGTRCVAVGWFAACPTPGR
jgi:hypothetical protein